jgi:epoxyqueuosine reductase
LVIAYPQFITRLNFRYNNIDYPVKIPPTYVYSGAYGRLEKILETVLLPEKYSFRKAKLPAKLLAVSSGLGMYGRNNICYVEGTGSFHRLFSYYTDIPCDNGSWTGKTVMPECKNCSACLNACPTGSISKNRFLIDAEKCITKFNENEGDFPAWIDKGWHNAIVGCLKCQMICPKNKDFIDKTEYETEFSNEETAMILENVPFSKLPESLRMKLDKLDLTEYYAVLCRNLSCLIK